MVRRTYFEVGSPNMLGYRASKRSPLPEISCGLLLSCVGRVLHKCREDAQRTSDDRLSSRASRILILSFGAIDAEVFRRRFACVVAFLACAIASAASQLYVTGALALITPLPLVGIGLGCLGEASNDRVVRRRCIYPEHGLYHDPVRDLN